MLRFYMLLIMGSALFTALQAQTSRIAVFSQAGEKFYLSVDGEVINREPAARVVARSVRNSTPLLKVDFEDTSIPSMKQSGWMEPGHEYLLKITTNRKGARVLRLQGQGPLTTRVARAERPDPAGAGQEVDQQLPAEVIATDVPSEAAKATHPVDGGVGTPNDREGERRSMMVNGDGRARTLATRPVATKRHAAEKTATNDRHLTSKAAFMRTQAMDGATAVPHGCGTPMATDDFSAATTRILGKDIEEAKLTVARQIIDRNCLSSHQVRSIMELFGFEDTKLDFAKFAYDHVVDRQNYHLVNDAFRFSSSVDELNKYTRVR